MKEFYRKIYRHSKEKFIKGIEYAILQNKKYFIVTANPEIFILAEQRHELKAALLRRQTLIVPDGIGIIYGGRKYKCKFLERIPGVELCGELLTFANREQKSLFLFGAKEEVIQTLEKRIRVEYPGVKICGAVNGYVEDKDSVFEEMKKLHPDIVLVALGAPVQEVLINKHFDDFEKGIFIGVGGSFDVLSGIKKRAPKFFVKCNLEWLYRIASEPKRIKRFWDNSVKFLIRIYFKKA